MKLLHFADLHLGIENYGRTDPATGLSSRLGDFLGRLDELVAFAIAERVDAVLFAGDAFKTRDPNPTVQRAFAERVRRLSRAAIPTVLLIGNHDLPSVVSRATSVDIYDALGVDHVRVCRRIEGFTLETGAGPLQIVTLPWITRSMLLTREEYRADSTEELEGRLRERVIAALEAEAATLDPAMPAVLMGHLSLSGASYGSEQSIMLGQDLVLSRGDLQPASFDYIALGHIHKHQQVGPSTPPAVYSGSLERVDFGEEREEKGFVLIEITPGAKGERAVRWAFRPVAARPFVTLRLDIGGTEPLDAVRDAIARRTDLRDAVVRARITLTPEAADNLRLSDVRRLLGEAGAAFVGQIEPQVERPTRVRLPMADAEALDPALMLGRWLDLQQTPAERQAVLLRYAEGLLRDTKEQEVRERG
ncbi:MAG: SbcD_Mre11 [uncultured Thermomicrobiales bacterium]|uniref:Nuclease SbcCD subunit D n=1 Tax=uncultured Thermomicrobiales bacterium TaxID=1645740 RepID=A0A6J4VN37_9BACT|nr:MAG: SbcD_Mre11 [uncultured Thermomicrobiales bacterium]